MKRALESVGLEIEISSEPSKILTADGIVLPGAGAFGPAAKRLIPLKSVGLRSLHTVGEWTLISMH